MQYIKINEDESRKLYPRKPNWLNLDGRELSDSELIEKGNIYPVVDEEVTDNYDSLKPKSIEEGVVESDHVLRTFGKIVDENPDNYDPQTDTLELKDESEGTTSGDTIYKTYQIYRDDKPNYDKKYEKISLKDESEGTEQDGVIYKEYDIIEFDFDKVYNKFIKLIADTRGEYETGGMSYNLQDGSEIRIHTGRESQSKIATVALGVKQGNITENKQWKTLDGFKELTPTQLEELGDNLNVFVQSCYNNESRILDLIKDATTVSDLKNIYDNEFGVGWPSNVIFGG